MNNKMDLKLERKKIINPAFSGGEHLKDRCLYVMPSGFQCGHIANPDSDFCSAHNRVIKRNIRKTTINNLIEELAEEEDIIEHLLLQLEKKKISNSE